MPRPKKNNTKNEKAEPKKRVSAKKAHANPNKKTASKAKPVFVDVINDDLEMEMPLSKVLGEKKAPVKADSSSLKDDAADLEIREESYFPADREEGGKFFDKQKHYYSDLVREMDSGSYQEDKEDDEPVKKTVRRRKSVPAYRKLVFRFLLLTAALLLVVAYFSFSSLTIDIVPNKEIISDSMNIDISTDDATATSSDSSQLLKGSVESQDIEAERTYSSSGEEILGEEVTGKVTLVNNYTKAQPLVATTRLLSSDNKLFRLKEGVTIPAGQSVEAEVYADSPSSSMAIGPSQFTIPGLWVGLQDKIYAKSTEPFTYQHKVENFIKQSDLDYAYSDIRSLVNEKAQAVSLDENAVLSIDTDNTIVESDAKLGDKVASFTVKAHNRVAIISFDKSTVEKMVESKLTYVVPDDKEIKNFDKNSISYQIESYDTKSNTAKIKVSFQATVALKNDASVLDKSKLVNLSEDQVGQYLKGIPAISSFTLDFRPDFIKKSPSLADRIKIKIED